MIFLIDFENVSNSGFNGVEKLEKTDKLLIFFSEKASSISLATHRKLEESKAAKEYYSIKSGGKNALDFQLSTYLGYLLSTEKSAEFCIVSNDSGYDFVIDFWKNRNIKIIRCADLSRETQEVFEDKVKDLLPDYADEAAKIVSIINKYKTKQGINNALVKEYGSEKTGTIYKAIRPLLKNKKDR